MVQNKSLAERVSAVTALDDPLRRDLLAYIARSPEPIGRDTIATEFGLPRSTAAFQLDRLVEQGLLEVEYRRLTGRTGPGSGRPAKLYRRAHGEVSVSFPERHYDLAAQLLATAVDLAAAEAVPVHEALAEAANAAGSAWGAGAHDLRQVLQENGFEPFLQDDGTIALANCPFHRLVADHTDTVCCMNLHLLRGAACACGTDPGALRLDPAPGRCCVTYRPESSGGGESAAEPRASWPTSLGE